MAIYKGLTRLREASYGKTPVAFIYWGAEQVWRALDDPENPEALYPLSEDSILSQSIEMTDGIYMDTEEKLEGNGVDRPE